MSYFKNSSFITETQNISKNYFICRNSFNLSSFSSGYSDLMSPLYIFYRDVEIALSLLEKEEKFIIQNEFFSNCNPLWWKPYFKKRTYLKKRDEATEKFVRLFHEIH